MTKNKLNRLFYILAVLVLFLGVKSVFASETFNNNLLKAEFHKSPIGGVKMVLFTGKPYSDSVTVNKKSDNEYVILMPETSNSLTGKPNLRFVSDVVKSVEVKSQPYQNNIKGYTKVVIQTYKPIEITPQVQTVSPVTFKLTENEYNELMTQASKKPAAKALAKQIPNQKAIAKTQMTKIKSSNVEKPKVVASKSALTKGAKFLVKKDVLKKPVKKAEAKPIIVKKVEKINKKTEKKSKPVEVIQKAVTQTKPITSQPVVAEKLPAEQSKPALTGLQPDVLPQTETSQAVKKPNIINLSVLLKKTSKVVSIVKNNIYSALAIALLFFIFLMLVARRMTAGAKRSQANFTTHLNDKPDIPIDYTEKINEDMNWKEKFKTCVETCVENETQDAPKREDFVEGSSAIVEQEDLNGFVPSSEELDELFKPDIYSEEESVDSEPQESPVYGDSEAVDSDELDKFLELAGDDDYDADVSIEDLFDENEEIEDNLSCLIEKSLPSDSPVFETNVVSPIDDTKPETEIVKSEFIIDGQKAFYLVDFEDSTALVGRIEDEIFVLKRFDKKINAPLKARLNEQSLNSVSYMTKVGGFRGVVEVTPEKMNLLIEL